VNQPKKPFKNSFGSGSMAKSSLEQSRFLQKVWSGEQDLNLRQLGFCGVASAGLNEAYHG
jgi:hypothetical protein